MNRGYQYLRKLEKVVIMEQSKDKEKTSSKIWGDKCQRSSTADRDTEVESASKMSKESDMKE